MTRPILGKRRTPISCTAKGGGSGVIIETVGLSHYHPLLLQSPPFPAKLGSKKSSPSFSPCIFFLEWSKEENEEEREGGKKIASYSSFAGFFQFLRWGSRQKQPLKEVVSLCFLHFNLLVAPPSSSRDCFGK